MFKTLFALFAIVAAAFAAPSPNPAVVAAPLAYSSLGYGAVPAVSTYGAYPAVATYGGLGAYPYAAAPVAYYG